MSVINQFNKLDGQTVSRKFLQNLSNKARAENQPDVWARVDNLLNSERDADFFTLELDKPIKQEFTGLGKIDAKVKGNELIYYSDNGVKLATIKANGTITYHKKRLPAGARNDIRKAASIIGLASPYVETPFDESMLHGLEYVSEEEEFTGLGKPVSPTDIYNYVTDLILNTIKTVGHLPWQKEWIGSGESGQAKNYVSKKPYNGINFVLLNFDIKYDKKKQPYLVPIKFDKPYYLTFNQIEEAKATLKAGSKAHRVIYYTMIFGYKNGEVEISTSDKGKYTSFIQSNGITPEQIKEFGKKIPVVKYYNVYRADDCTGLKFAPEPKPKTTSPIEQAQAIIDGYPKPPKYTFVGADAYYQPANDLVNMPKISAFTKEQFYYSTFFHEIIHSTGHSKRLDRGNDTRKRDGSKEDKKAYAFEELVAELGAVFLCSEAGILFTTVENSAKYLKGWNSRLITELENDNRFFLKASAQAQKAANWILDRNQVKDEVTKTAKAKKVAPVKKEVKPKVVNKTAKAVTKTAKTVTKKVASVTKNQKRKAQQEIAELISKGKPGIDAIIEVSEKLEKSIKLTASQKKRYDKELASDNWKKYSKTQKVANNSKKVSDIAKKNANKTTIKPKATQKPKPNATKKLHTKEKVIPKTELSAYEKQELAVYSAYLEYKERNPKHIIFMPFDDIYMTFNDDAKTVSEIVDIPLHRKDIDGKFYYKAVFPDGMLKLNIARLMKAHFTVGVVELAKPKGKSKEKSALGNSYTIHNALNSPLYDVPVYVNAPMDDTTKEIVDIIKETIPAEAIVVHQPTAQPTNKLMQMEFESLPMDEGWENLMQDPAANMKIAMFGPPKNGKTAAALQKANYLTKFGNVLYNFADQGFNLSTKKLWIESGLANNPKAEPSDINTLAKLDAEIATGKYKFVFIDMISDYIRLEKIKPEEFKANFMRKYPDVSFILIFEVTKAGTFKGDEGWMHIVDAIMNVEHFVISNRGRYGFGKRVIWEEGFANSDPKGYAEWLENNTEEVDPEVIKFSEEIERI